jgi:hypothetical protein
MRIYVSQLAEYARLLVVARKVDPRFALAAIADINLQDYLAHVGRS